MAPGQQSSYSAISAMAIDPIYIAVPRVPEFQALGGEDALSSADRATLRLVPAAPRLDHHAVRQLKLAAPRAAVQRFLQAEWRPGPGRGPALPGYVRPQGSRGGEQPPFPPRP